MEHLIDLIRTEFELAQYEPLGGDRMLWKHSEFNDFWLICDIDGNFDLDVLQEQIFANLAPTRKKYPQSEKSTSLLILQNVHEAKDKTPQQVIDVENDVYYFKKYVIQFTSEDWEATQKAIPTNYQNLGRMLMQPDVFEQVKANEKSPYLLLYTIAHKLPFVMMNAERRDYDPNPTFVFNAELQSVFAWTEKVMDVAGRNASEEELTAAKAAITCITKAKGNE